jgi:hypothetical protein
MRFALKNQLFFEAKLAFNVSAVTDVFLCPIRKNAEHFYGRKKMWRRKTAQRA